ncbi:MAG TPA: hypothetical protein VLB80_02645 [Candidatus Babeliales bacterium]|nr:hypothetical protein [Candidatus Babeliales bacterium]
MKKLSYLSFFIALLTGSYSVAMDSLSKHNGIYPYQVEITVNITDCRQEPIKEYKVKCNVPLTNGFLSSIKNIKNTLATATGSDNAQIMFMIGDIAADNDAIYLYGHDLYIQQNKAIITCKS